MTYTKQQKLKKPSKALGYSIIIFIVIFDLLTVLNGQKSMEAVKQGLSICFFTVIPSLFPFMCIFEILRRSGIMEALSSLFWRPFCKLFALPPCAFCAVLCGLCCSAPLGMKMARELYCEGKLNREECQRLICFCGCPSFSYLISGVGIGLYNSFKIGATLYFSVVLANLLLGFILSYNKEKKVKPNKQEVNIKFSAENFTESVVSSTETIIKICGFVIIFSVLTDVIAFYILNFFNDILSVAVLGAFEFVCGINYSANLLPLIPSVVMCGAIAAWSGFSLHMQTIAIFGGSDISFKKYFISKLIVSILSLVFTFILVSIN